MEADIHPYDNYTPCATGAVAHTVFLKLSPLFHDYVEGGAYQTSDTTFRPFAEWRVYPLDAVYRPSTHSVSPTTYTTFRLRYHNVGTGFDVDWYTSTGWETLSTTNQLVANHGWAEQEVSVFDNSDLYDDHKSLLYMNNPTTQSYVAWTDNRCDTEALMPSSWEVLRTTVTNTFTAYGITEGRVCP